MQKYNISNTALKMIKKDDEEEKKNNETTKNEDMNDKSFNEVLLDLDDIKNKYSSKDYVDAPDELKLDKINVPNKTEDELLSIAKSSLDKKYTSNKEATNSSFENKINNLLKKQNDYKTNAESSKKIINETYDEAINNTNEQALKRGLARSSIIINQLSQLNKSKASDLLNVMNNLQTNILENQNQIKQLENERDSALNSLDISYAIELDEKLNSLKSDYEEKVKEAIDFNNKVEKLKAEYKIDLDKQKIDRLETVSKLEKDNKFDYTQNKIKEAQFEYLKNYFDSLNKDYAINLFLTNKELLSILGDNYSKMYNYLKNK